MKLLFVSNLFPDASNPVRGLDNACLLHELASEVDEVRAVAIRPTLKPREDFRCRDVDESLQPVYCPVPYIPKFGSRWNHRLMARSLERTLKSVREDFDFDLVLGSWLYPDGCALAHLAPRMGFDYWLICQGSDAHQYLEIPIRRRLIVEAAGGSKGVITRSADLARRLRDAGVGESQLHPVYNGVDTGLFRPSEDREASCKALGLDPAADYLLFVGNLLPVKNPTLLIEAWALARKASGARDLRLIMIGTGPLEQEIRDLAKLHGVGDFLTLAGRQPPGVVADYFRVASCLVMSSLNEGVPNVILESFASGVPVISTDVGGISEVLNASYLGKLVPSQDVRALALAIGETLDQSHDYQRISDHGAAFSWSNTAAKYLDLMGH